MKKLFVGLLLVAFLGTSVAAYAAVPRLASGSSGQKKEDTKKKADAKKDKKHKGGKKSKKGTANTTPASTTPPK